jgi:hypothetical protein
LDQYDDSADRGCGDDAATGCSPSSTVFGFLAHSDEFNPEVMQGTRGISLENVGRRFRLSNFLGDDAPTTVSGRLQNWLDVDGSVSELGTATMIGSGYADCGLWWRVDDNVVEDVQGPLTFIPQTAGPERGLGHVHMEWDSSLHSRVGGDLCGNGSGVPCPPVGWIRHRGARFASDNGLSVTANADVAGPVGGFGWYMELLEGAPVRLTLNQVEADPSTPLMFSVAYPAGTVFSVIYHAAEWCNPDATWSCEESFTAVGSVQAVRESLGNTYYLSNAGLLTFRIIMTSQAHVGNPDWFFPGWETPGEEWRGLALGRFERNGVLLPRESYGPELVVTADCASSDGIYCNQDIAAGAVQAEVDAVCPSGLSLVSYDRCCDASRCVYANGEEFFL